MEDPQGVFELIFVCSGDALADGFEVESLEFGDLVFETAMPIESGGFVDAQPLGNALEAEALGTEFDEGVLDVGGIHGILDLRYLRSGILDW